MSYLNKHVILGRAGCHGHVEDDVLFCHEVLSLSPGKTEVESWIPIAKELTILSYDCNDSLWANKVTAEFFYIVIHGLQLPLSGITTRIIWPSEEYFPKY